MMYSAAHLGGQWNNSTGPMMHSEVVVKHPRATDVLRFGLDVLCNTDDEVILSNVLENARKVKRWAKSLPPHGRTLLICGSGPSIRKDTDLIREMSATCDVWALNNCANYLNSLGMIPDAQVIMDAQEVNLQAIGAAREYLFASQCHPKMFDAVDATLWHATLGDIKVDEQPGFPEHDDAYCLIGSAVSVGNTAMILAFALGYRDIHLFGYDSSNEGVSHVIPQQWNAGEPMTMREFRGKHYECSLTMALQADAFTERASVLVREGCKLTVHGYGYLPDRWNAALSEQDKYAMMWAIDGYRETSPGEEVADLFIEMFKPSGRVIDFGCGTGRAGVKLAKAGCDVLLSDFTVNSRDKEAQSLPFIQHDLTQPFPESAQWGYCTDVMEHIPTADVDAVIRNIMGACQKCFFQISTVPDVMGAHIGQVLHLTVQPLIWWVEKFRSLGYAINWQREDQTSVLFLIER